MKSIRLAIVALFLMTVAAMSVLGQVQQPVKVGLIDTGGFYHPSEGIAKIIDAYKKLDIEFKAATTELESGSAKLESLKADIERLSNTGSKVPVDQNAVQAKYDEAEKLQRDLKFKQEDAKVRFEKREAQLLSPIIQELGSALDEYAKKNGYTVLLDIGKLAQEGMILFWDESTDVTEDFIKIYNAKPAGSASTKP